MKKRLGVKGLLILMLAFLMWVPGVASANTGSVNDIFVGDPPVFKSVAAVISRSNQGTAMRTRFNGALDAVGMFKAMRRSGDPLTLSQAIALLRSGNQETSIKDIQIIACLLSQGALSANGIMNSDALEIVSKILQGESDSGIMHDRTVQDHDIRTEATFTGKHRSQIGIIDGQSILALGQLHLRQFGGTGGIRIRLS